MSLRLLAVCLAAGALGAAEFSSQVIELPPETLGGFTVACQDADGGGKADLFVLAPAERTLLAYFQRPGGFSPQPDQTIELPTGTAWVRLCDVASDPGCELVFSGPSGLRYRAQERGRFGPAARSLLDVSQVLSGDPAPLFLENRSGEEALLPVFLAGRTLLYAVEPGGALRLARTIELEATSSIVLRDSGWSLGAGGGRALDVRTLHAGPPNGRAQDPERVQNAGIRAPIDVMAEGIGSSIRCVERADIDGDRREDLLDWRVSFELPFKTTAMVHLCGTDGGIPDAPSKVLRCPGVPALRTGDGRLTILADVDEDGRAEILLVELRTNPMSIAQIAEMFISQGVEWTLAIRSFQPGRGCADRPDARIPFTALPHEMALDMLHLEADLDGDGRKDLAVRRTLADIDVFPGREEGWFTEAPAFRLNCPVGGQLVFRDLNEDRASDIIALDYERRRIGILLSHGAGGKPR